MDIRVREETLPLKAGRAIVFTTSHLQSFALLLARLGFGFSLFLTGRGHLHNVEKMIERFTDWHVPMPRFSVYVSGYTEMIGGLLLMAGLLTRPVALVLAFNFVVAYLTASIDKVKAVAQHPGVSDNWGEILDDAAFPFLMISLVFLAFGAGKVSIDYLIKRIVYGKEDLTRRRIQTVDVTVTEPGVVAPAVAVTTDPTAPPRYRVD